MKKKVTFRINAKLARQLKTIASSVGKSQEELVEEAITESLKKLKNQPNFMEIAYEE